MHFSFPGKGEKQCFLHGSRRHKYPKLTRAPKGRKKEGRGFNKFT